MSIIRIPTPLRVYTNGNSEIKLEAKTVAEALANLIAFYPALLPHIYNENGELRPFVNLFLGDENIMELQGLSTPLKETDRLLIIPSIAGGC